MKILTIYRAAAVALPFLTLMPSGPAGAQPARPCNSGVCKVDVSVQSCDNGTLSVTYDPIPVPSPNRIEWTLATDGYKFPADGIKVASDDFDSGNVTGNGRKFSVRDKHTKLGEFKYSVKVVRTSDNKTCKVWDPVIRNE